MNKIVAAFALFLQMSFLSAAGKVNQWIAEEMNIKLLAQNMASIALLQNDLPMGNEENEEKIVNVLNISSLPIMKQNSFFSLQSKAGIVLDTDSDVILFEKRAKEKMQIASLTKLMTAIVVMENIDLSEIVEISKKAIDTEGNRVSLKVGEKLSVESLLYMLLLKSSNDAAVALAEHTALSVENFIILMNRKAGELGLKNTVFSCPSGLDDENNFSCAYDIAQLADYALGKPLLWEIMRTQEKTVFSADGARQYYLGNINKLLKYSVDVLGGKTGYTEEAGGCLFLLAQHPENGRRIITVVLNSDDRFSESQRLFEWVFDSYQW